jgi:purine catabolism regulator
VATSGSLTCALVPGMDEEDLFALAHRATSRLGTELEVLVQAGVGRAVPVGDARRSFHEARCALDALTLGMSTNGSSSNGGSGAAGPNAGPAGAGGRGGSGARLGTYKDLGSFQLLLSLQDDEALRLFCDSILGPIEASEGHYGGELMRSLEAFIEENGQWERAARRLYCHRHTLRYRIRRVEELTGRNLGSARDRIEFWLALRGRELVP